MRNINQRTLKGLVLLWQNEYWKSSARNQEVELNWGLKWQMALMYVSVTLQTIYPGGNAIEEWKMKIWYLEKIAIPQEYKIHIWSYSTYNYLYTILFTAILYNFIWYGLVWQVAKSYLSTKTWVFKVLNI